MRQPKILIANRGEIAVRIQRTARKLGIPTVAIYTLIDSETPHVSQADEAYLIGDGLDPKAYLDIDAIVEIAKKSGATMVAPGYGFVSENSNFVEAIEAAGITFLGPTPHQMTSMGLKHEARAVAIKAGVPVVPGTGGVVETLEDALEAAEKIGYPVMLKASAGGGGMGMTVCNDANTLKRDFQATREKGQSLFKNPAVFLEKYISRARHVEVQIFGNGEGHVVHFGERECSVQRRHQKVIEESPCPLFETERGQAARKRMCDAAVALGRAMNYRSAGTVEFVLDDQSPNYDFYFLELNARIQVEHAVTEVVRPGLDLIELMILQGLAPNGSLPVEQLPQDKFAPHEGHSIEARVYCENPKADFRPSPGRLQLVEWADIGERGRIDTWVKTGTIVTPSYDPMIAKLVVWGKDRATALSNLRRVLMESRIAGPITNMDYCRAILETKEFQEGAVTTKFLDTMPYYPAMLEIIAPGISTTIQDLPGRYKGLGIPRSGAADPLSHKLANFLVGNDPNTEALEMTMTGAKVLFHADTIVAVTGAEVPVTVDKKPAEMWKTLCLKAGSVLNIASAKETGMRIYLAVRGGFPTIATYMGSKSTFVGASLGGYQGRALFAGDMITIEPQDLSNVPIHTIDPAMRPQHGAFWEIEVMPSAQWDEEFVSVEGMKSFLGAEWTVSGASNRAGLRLEGPPIGWARSDGGEGGGHPSNILDQGYAFGALNMNGDTPVLFGADGPDMGGFANILAVTYPSMWKLGQMRPGDKLRFVLVTAEESYQVSKHHEEYFAAATTGQGKDQVSIPSPKSQVEKTGDSLVTTSTIHREGNIRIAWAGDEFIIFELGEMTLDLAIRLQVELWERDLKAKQIPGIDYFNTCIRSSVVRFDPKVINPEKVAHIMLDLARSLQDIREVELPIRIHRMPIVPDDPWTKEATEYYMRTARKEAVYLPNNGQYIARNNGRGPNAVSDALRLTPWLVIARGFFLMLPFVIPLDPRQRLLAQKYNPSRTRTPEGALCVAGVIGSIHPVETPGGYQMLARTLSTMQPWSDQPSKVENFDQIEFYIVEPEEFEKIERDFKAGLYKIESRESTFKMKEYLEWIDSIEPEVAEFKKQQKEASEKLLAEEAISFQKFLQEKKEEADRIARLPKDETAVVGLPVTAPLQANVWKIYVKEGDKIEDDDQRIVELEAMKTSVWITPGDDTVGKVVKSIRVKEGEAVGAGTVLLELE